VSRPQAFVDNDVERLAERLGPGVAEYTHRSGIPEAYDPVEVSGNDRICVAGQQRFAQNGLGDATEAGRYTAMITTFAKVRRHVSAHSCEDNKLRSARSVVAKWLRRLAEL
jgi:hypothetical protein